jgi:hypothetical protein
MNAGLYVSKAMINRGTFESARACVVSIVVMLLCSISSAGEIAEIEAGSQGVYVTPLVASPVVVTVAGPSNLTIRGEVAPSGGWLSDDAGLPDGVYTYETTIQAATVAAPSAPPAQGADKEHAIDENGRPIGTRPAAVFFDEPLQESGSFTLIDGLMADPEMIE